MPRVSLHVQPAQSCCCCSLRTSIFVFAVLDCIHGPLGFVGCTIELARQASNITLEYTRVSTDVPITSLLLLLYYSLLICSGAVGIQAFNTLHLATAKMLCNLKLVIFLSSSVLVITDAAIETSRGNTLSFSVMWNVLWWILVPLYIVYIVWSFVKSIEENIWDARGPAILTPSGPPQVHRLPAETNRIHQLPGFIVEPRGHCSVCFAVPGSSSTCRECVAHLQAEATQLNAAEVVEGIAVGHPTLMGRHGNIQLVRGPSDIGTWMELTNMDGVEVCTPQGSPPHHVGRDVTLPDGSSPVDSTCHGVVASPSTVNLRLFQRLDTDSLDPEVTMQSRRQP